MKAVLIGSAVYRDSFKDLDLIADSEFVSEITYPQESITTGSRGTNHVFRTAGTILEVMVPNPETAHHLVLRAKHKAQRKLFDHLVGVCDLPMLAALKKAHLVSHHKWKHHIGEYAHLKGLLGVDVFVPLNYGLEVEEVFKLHRKEVQEGVKLPKLNVKKDYFFEDAEFKIFDHDTVHKAVALGPEPAYTLMQDGEVWCSKKKWDALTPEKKLSCVIEEACVLALERSIIPALYLDTQFRGATWAYEFALSKIATTITSGWFREYTIEHYQEAAAARPDYVNTFLEGLKNGLVKILKPEVVLGV